MTDEELLRAWKDGDAESGRALLARHFDALCRFFRNKIDREVEDLIQRTMLVCLQNFERLREAPNFRAYLFAIARNQLFRHLSKARKQDDRIDFSATSIHDLAPTMSRLVAERHEGELLLTALRQIPVDEQMALELFYWEDLTYAEIAEVLDIHPDTVKRRLTRARGRLRETLAALGGPGPGTDDAAVDTLARGLKDTVTG